MNRTAIYYAAIVLTTSTPWQTVLAAESVYTDLDFDRCAKTAEDEMSVRLSCDGYRSFQVHFAEDDLRQSVFYGPIRDDILAQAFESFEPFNTVNTKIEWRVDETGKPFATILRWFLENPGADGVPDKASMGQVLVISRVAQPSDPLGCVVGYVDALSNSQPNELARAVADRYAAAFSCGNESPTWHGRRGDKAADPSNVWLERAQ